jgi:hypothetical protein
MQPQSANPEHDMPQRTKQTDQDDMAVRADPRRPIGGPGIDLASNDPLVAYLLGEAAVVDITALGNVWQISMIRSVLRTITAPFAAAGRLCHGQ